MPRFTGTDRVRKPVGDVEELELVSSVTQRVLAWIAASRVVQCLQLFLRVARQARIPCRDEATVRLGPAVGIARVPDGHLGSRLGRADVPDLGGDMNVDVAATKGVAGIAGKDWIYRR